MNLGCAKNQVDGEEMLGVLAQRGYQLAAAEAEADLFIVNTCGFIDAAKEEAVNEILRLATAKSGDQILVAAGCLAQRYARELMEEIPELDGLLGVGRREELPRLLLDARQGKRPVLLGPGDDRDLPRMRLDAGVTAYLKIAEGCNHGCTFCAIPGIRGSFQSRPLNSVVREAKELAAQGVKELILVAQDTAFYGCDLGAVDMLPLLVREIAHVPGIEWVRILYLHPDHLSQGLIKEMAGNHKVCAYLDIPLQHASPRVLRRMGRRGSGDDFLGRLAEIRSMVPEVTVRSTFIVGFPGETEQDFDTLLEFLAVAGLDWAGFFAYSREEGTPAAAFPEQIEGEVAMERLRLASDTQANVTDSVIRRWAGQGVMVLVEGEAPEAPGWFRGRFQGQAPEVDGQTYVRGEGLAAGQLRPAVVTRTEGFDLWGLVT